MKQENKSESITSEKPDASATPGGKGAAAPSAPDAAGGATLDFQSAEFNHIDDLNDYSGNYRSFQPLDGVVTADMRHQMERQSHGAAIDSFVDNAAPLKKMEKESDDAESLEVSPFLTVISQGRTLIVDTDAGRAIACGKILTDQGLTCTLLVTKNAAPDGSLSRLGRLEPLAVKTVSISGAFGGFSAMVTLDGDQKQLTKRFGKEAVPFDLVLDFQSTPSFVGDCLPMGYYALGPNPMNLSEVMAELPEMKGRFNKPQFTAFLKNRCTHGRSRTRDCRQCLTVCPFGAIQSVDRKISINHYLCQGCGGCALVCPSDAIHRVQPSQEELVNNLRHRLENQSEGADFPPTLVISDSETADGNKLLDGVEGNHGPAVLFKVEQIGHVGLELLVAALAYGAGRVLVACGSQNPPKIRKAVEWQTQMAGAILRGLHMPADKIRFALLPPENNDSEKAGFTATGFDARPNDSLTPPAAWSPRLDKRTMVRLATRHLYDQSGVREPGLPLPTDSPYGAVAVDSAACTLCMACAVACPSGALSAAGDAPRLEFLESRCHQCGLCEETCPEAAIQRQPRILCDTDAVEAREVLCEVEPFRCIECGTPFGTQAMINCIQDKLRGHWMYADDRQLRRLQMCRICRTRDALMSQDMKSWNQQ